VLLPRSRLTLRPVPTPAEHDNLSTHMDECQAVRRSVRRGKIHCRRRLSG